MKISRKTILNVLLIAFVLAFFVTPLGYQGKILLNRIFSFSPDVIEVDEEKRITDYNWKLKDANWEFFNFENSMGNVVFINFWASWRLPCAAELKSIQNLYDSPVTYLIIGEKTPLALLEPPSSYIIDKNGYIRVMQEGIADWDNKTIYNLLNELTE